MHCVCTLVPRALCSKQQAECTAETEKAQNAALTAIANSQRDYETQKASFDKDVNERRAQAELAYNLQASKVNQLISAELGEIDVVERKKQIEIESEEVLRKDKELIGTINRPAEANRFKVETLAEGSKEARINTARGEAEAIKMVGSAEASKILAIGEAEAEAMRVKAEAFKTYGDAAITEMILNVLPTVRVCPHRQARTGLQAKFSAALLHMPLCCVKQRLQLLGIIARLAVFWSCPSVPVRFVICHFPPPGSPAVPRCPMP